MRPSGRAPDEMRAITIETGYTKHAEGSCLVSFGETRVLCTASVEERVPAFLEGSGQGWVTAEYGMLPRSTGSRMRREPVRAGKVLGVGGGRHGGADNRNGSDQKSHADAGFRVGMQVARRSERRERSLQKLCPHAFSQGEMQLRSQRSSKASSIRMLIVADLQ